MPFPTRQPFGALPRGQTRLALLCAAALLGGAVACSVVSNGNSTIGPTEPAVISERIATAPVQSERPKPADVDAAMVRTAAQQALLEQGQPANLTDTDLVARDVLAGGPLAVADVHHKTQETLSGFGPGGPFDTSMPPQPECPPTARACIDVSGKRAWLQTDSRITYGPVPITTGKPGYETTLGSHRVLRHVRHDHSRIFDSPMPFSTYFTTSGMAFHEGRLDEPSHGCIHLGQKAAAQFFDQLRVGDEVVAF